MKIFSERLKYERINKGLTQKQLADALRIPRSTYSHYEADSELHVREPSFETVCDIAKLLGVSIDYLFGLED